MAAKTKTPTEPTTTEGTTTEGTTDPIGDPATGSVVESTPAVATADAGTGVDPNVVVPDAEAAPDPVIERWKLTGEVPSGYGVNFDATPPIFKLPEAQVATLEAEAEAERQRAEARETALAELAG